MRADRRFLVAVTIAAGMGVAIVSVPATAGATEPEAEASGVDTFKEALAAYDAGRFAEASELFERAYRQTRAPGLLFNIAQSARKIGDCPRAVAYYRRFIAEDPASPDRPRAEEWIAELGSCPEAAPPLGVAQPPAPATPAAAAAPATPSAPPPVTPPSEPLVVLSQTPATQPGAGRSRVPGLALIAAAAALGGAGAVLGLQSMHDSSEISSVFAMHEIWTPSDASIDREGQRDQTLSIVLFSVAAAAAVAGAAYLLATSPRGHDRGP
jgi:hypothetical protein